MKIEKIKEEIPEFMFSMLKEKGINELYPSQEKSINAGLLQRKNLLVCTPTASGKTLIAEMAAVNSIVKQIGKVIYIVPLKALASEKYNEFKKRYGSKLRIALSIGNTDSADTYLENYDFIITTSEKLDSLIRHHTPWLKYVSTVIIDEVHLLNDASRGPTLEILITILREVLKDIQLISLSATIGNPKELASWLNAELVIDTWRPVELKQGVYCQGQIQYYP
jgi:helicase